MATTKANLVRKRFRLDSGRASISLRRVFAWGGDKIKTGGHEVALAHPKCHVHEPDERRHFDEWPDHTDESFASVQAKDRDGYSDCQLKVISGCGEGECR